MKCKNCKKELKPNQKFCPECGAEINTKKKLSKKAQAFIACACCLVLIITGTIGGLYFKNSVENNNEEDSNYIMLNEGFTDVKVTDEKSALEAINTVSDIIGINDVNNELKAQCVDTIDNTTFYRFQQYYNDIPVYGKSVNMPVYSDGQVAALTSNYCVLNNDLPTEATASQSDMEKSLKKYFDNQDITLESLDVSKLVYYITEDNKAVLAYELRNTVAGYVVFVNANSSEVIFSNSLFSYASAEVQSEDGEVKAIGWQNDDGSYHLYNGEHKISVFDFSSIKEKSEEWNFKDLGIDTIYSSNNYFDKKAVQLMYDLCMFDNYFKKLGDVGFYQIHAAINDCIGTNARAKGTFDRDGTNLRFGAIMIGKDRDINDVDIIAHEYTHMVSKSLLDLDGMEASAINEGFSDIFGEILQEYLHGEIDWKHDERNIADPSNESNNQKYPNSVEFLENAKKEWFANERYMINKSQSEDYSHFASTIISHTAYLMWNGIDGTDNNKISTDELAKLWYNSLFLMPSNPTFSQCRNAVELSARIMLKNGELTQEQYKCVCAAFDTVGIKNANYTYQSKTQNDFNLKVLNSKETDNVNFNLKIYKLRNYEFDIKSIIKQPKLVLEENSLYGNKQLHLDDGIYLIEITDLDENVQNAEPITIKIIVDGDEENAKDEVIIKTDFSDITTVVLNKEEKDENLATLPGKYLFSSGVGAWSTELNINDDFTFSGMYHDSELGLTGEKNPNGTVIICEFTGKFLTPEKIDDYTYKLSIDSLSLKNKDGYVYYNDGIEYECVGEPYGFDGCREFYFYTKGKETSDLTEEFLSWIYEYDETYGVLPCNCIRNSQTDVCFVKYESTESNNTENESTTTNTSIASNTCKYYGNETAEQLRKSIIGSWGALGSIVPEYNFIDSEICSGENPWQSSGTYSISDDKTLIISWAGASDSEKYIWSAESWDEFYSHHEHKENVGFWCMTDDGVLKLNGKEKYRDGVNNYTYNSDGDLMATIVGTWLSDRGRTEYCIYSDGTWEESTVSIAGGTLINRTVLDNGKVEIVDDTTAELWQEVEHLNQIPGASELIYDSKNDKISVGGTNNTYSRAKYK